MILFNNFSEDKKFIYFKSTKEQKIIIKIIDTYTKLCSYKSSLHVVPDVLYHFGHLAECNSKYFEIWDLMEQNLLLKMGIINNEVVNIKDEDKYNLLKDFNIRNNIEDISVSVPLYEIFTSKIYDKFFSIEKGDVVFDIGGNVGFFSYYALCKEASKVYCFEPSSTYCNIINKNFKSNKLILEEAAVSLHEGTIDFYYNENYSIVASTYPSDLNLLKTTCQSINLNNYIKENNISKIDYLKIDCEGAEYDIIETLDKDYLKYNVNKICLEYHYNKGQLINIINKLKECNFKVNFEFSDYQINDELGIIYAYK